MIKKLKSLLTFLLIITLIIPTIPVLAANTGTTQLVKKPGTENTYMTVALAYYVVNMKDNGTWVGNIGPGSENVNTYHEFDWEFQGKTVKSVKISKYTNTGENTGEQQRIWDNTRVDVKRIEVQNYLAYPKEEPTIIKLDGIKTSSIHLEVKTRVDLNEKGGEPLNEDADGIITDYKYYVPFVVEIEFEPLIIPVIIQHFSVSGEKLAENVNLSVEANEPVSADAKEFEGYTYQICKISYDNAGTWDHSKTTKSVSEVITKPTIIRFYYDDKETDELVADLKLTANPSAIKKGTTANVLFKLNASESRGKNPIVKYEFSFGNSETKLSSLKSGTESIVTTTKSNVAPLSTWYAKVKVTDSKGKTATATADVTIDELEENVKAYARIDNVDILPYSKDLSAYSNTYNLSEYIEKIVPLSGGNGCTVYIKSDPKIVPSTDNKKMWANLAFDPMPDAIPSWATNGVEKYVFDYKSLTFTEKSITENTPTPRIGDSEMLTNDHLYNLFKYGGQEEMDFWVTVNDKVQKDVSATSNRYYVYFKAAEESGPPTVDLKINKPEFMRQETAIFTPTFKEYSVPITGKRWEIYSTTNTFEDNGSGEITKEYLLNVPIGHYQAKQYITYKDEQGETASRYATVDFDVLQYFKPDVTIATDKEKYALPTTVKFITTFIQNNKTYPIESKEWAIKASDGSLVASGEGTCPTSKYFDLDTRTGVYQAEQTIHWTEYGEAFSKTATCQFILINPIPVAKFTVAMQKSFDLDHPVWDEKDFKQYKQIRIDLNPSIEMNKDLPYAVLLNHENTQIVIIPLKDDGITQDLSKNDSIQVKGTKIIEGGYVKVKGTGVLDVRFDKAGKYDIKVRVANQATVAYNRLAPLTSKVITVRPDLAPKISFNFIDVGTETDTSKSYKFKILRAIQDLKVKFGLNVVVTPQDDDSIDTSTAKLDIRYDYNADDNTSNDGVHSNMKVTTAANNVQPYMQVNKNADMSQFDFSFFDQTAPILGKIKFDYVVNKLPVIPYFDNTSFPNRPPLDVSTYALVARDKIVFVDNRPGLVKVEVGKSSKVEIIYYAPMYTLNDLPQDFIDLINTTIAHYKDDAKIYLIDKNSEKHLIH